MIALLSPAKALDLETPLPLDVYSQPQYSNEAFYLVSKLKKCSAKKIGKLMNLSEQLSQLNYERYQNFQEEHSNHNSRPAFFSFNGDVYRGLNAFTLKNNQAVYASKHIRILSGLYGILQPFDLIQPYRLEMGCGFPVTPKKDNLYKFWKPLLADCLNKEIENSKSKVLVNLTSNEYFKAVDEKKLKFPIIHCDFKENKGGEYKTISFLAKRARGLMARYMIDQEIDRPEGLKGFESEGYVFSTNLSTEQKWIFVRN